MKQVSETQGTSLEKYKPRQQLAGNEPSKAMMVKAAERLLSVGNIEKNNRSIIDAIASALPNGLQKREVIDRSHGQEVVVRSIWNQPIGITEDQLAKVRQIVAMANAPAKKSDILMWVTRLRAETTTSKESAEERKMADAARVERLAKYPADIVRELLDIEGKGWKFYPSWAELEEILQGLCKERREIVGHVTRWKVWTDKDQISHLKDFHAKLNFHANYYRRSDPERSARAQSKADEVEREICNLTGTEPKNVSDQDIDDLMKNFHRKMDEKQV